MKKISIFGATGSIGQSTLKVIAKHPDLFQANVLTAYKNVEQLAQDAKKFNARYAVIADETLYKDLKSLLSGTDIIPMAGRDGVLDAASIKTDLTMAAIIGVAGLEPLMKSIQNSNVVAIANKEPLVAAGELVIETAQKSDCTILPVDSEHNAIFQVFEPENKAAIERLIITASGGPFRTFSIEEMKEVTVEQALNHPNWSMGQKLTIDSATMMNKALEVIEAAILFDMPADKIDVLVHPQSIIHSMVEYNDGSILSQMGASDMCTPIANAMAYPQRISTPGARLNVQTLRKLDFEPVDTERFAFVNMAYEALNTGIKARIAMNAANEIAVEAFLNNKIGFLDIYNFVKEQIDNLDKLGDTSIDSLRNIIDFDALIREKTTQSITNKG